MNKVNKICQSCGMPLKKDPKGGGTNSDGSKNLKYCSYCYENGVFLYTGTLTDFQAFCRQKMREGGHSKFISWILTRGMARLERWKK
ncbi:zinc ribbon domain-containing protein [Labilibaculum sp.]|uniref:zinc ribbon domain-containing protein n=1 Tax=Labilibaculum sp. TaxID=2060723 RepID=UPI002AA65C88|nr:zinc ribbon domain-containing protein [Labilibaculum sp.]